MGKTFAVLFWPPSYFQEWRCVLMTCITYFQFSHPLQDKAVQFREMGISAVTFQDFVNTLSGKRTLSFKCAMHCRDRQIVAPSRATSEKSKDGGWDGGGGGGNVDGYMSR